MNDTSVATLISKVFGKNPSNRVEATTLFLHNILLHVGEYKCTHVHDTELQNSTTDLPDNWNSTSACFSFQYSKEDKQYQLRVRIYTFQPKPFLTICF